VFHAVFTRCYFIYLFVFRGADSNGQKVPSIQLKPDLFNVDLFSKRDNGFPHGSGQQRVELFNSVRAPVTDRPDVFNDYKSAMDALIATLADIIVQRTNQNDVPNDENVYINNDDNAFMETRNQQSGRATQKGLWRAILSYNDVGT